MAHKAKSKEPKKVKGASRGTTPSVPKGGKKTDLTKVAGSGKGGMSKNKGSNGSTC